MKVFFVRTLLMALLGLEVTFAQSNKPLYTFPIGVQAYTYRNEFAKDVEKTLDLIASLGITEIEGNTPKGLTPEAYKQMLQKRKLTIPATGASYEELVSDPQSVIKQAKALGSRYVMVAWIPHQGAFNIDHAKKAVEDFNKAGKVLKAAGLTFCYHNHGYEFSPYEQGTLFDYLVKNTNPSDVSFELDVLWAQHGGADPVALLKKYGKRFELIHLKDLKKGVKGDFTGSTPLENDVALGTGQIDIPGVIKEAKRLGIRHYFIEDESPSIAQQVPQSIGYLKGLKE
ncbi:sugar phosphate isomerase/epimerase family protein [Siphonobacter curvatus]|uniref:Sugar phosphate isomerase n=1 Tax=Siphonobacter curvatus TaxID=2094562 RepID=A0A2S7IH20_9BACT|nr:sugar phosphate isomerase/epimerase [Siphonobacter curvatus]PQA54925.1 sugar phosphate isomerase [Siphonobacter curvatus]